MQGDVLGVVFVYTYVAVLILSTEKVIAKKYPVASRKILHILTGNIAFILPLFETREIMAFVAAGPFIVFTFLMSPYSPLKSFRGKTSQAGHSFGLVYYAIAWTVLAYLFFDHKVIIAVGILSMSYGDGLASLVGVRFGKKKYQVVHDVKSFIGSFAMFVCTFIVLLVAVFFYQVSFSYHLLLVAVVIAWVAMFVEGVTPFGLDNLSVPFITAVLFWFFVIM
ncbi:MAG: SEC59/DGK1/VTE5 family protein [Candidatus Thermoplasmatota archaeon]